MSNEKADTGATARVMSGGEAVVESLSDHGVSTVFGIPGIQLDPAHRGVHDELTEDPLQDRCKNEHGNRADNHQPR